MKYYNNVSTVMSIENQYAIRKNFLLEIIDTIYYIKYSRQTLKLIFKISAREKNKKCSEKTASQASGRKKIN